MGWARARKPEQKEQRRAEILTAAGALFDAGGLDAASLTAIAKEAGVSKANIYRYFESREAVLLSLLLEQQKAWVTELGRALAPLAAPEHAANQSAGLEQIADVLSRTLIERPRMCGLMSSLASVLEHNVSRECVTAFKLEVLSLMMPLGAALGRVLPELDETRLREFMTFQFMIVCGLWPHGHPSPVVAEVCAQPGFEGMAIDYETVLRRHTLVTLRGLLT